MIATPPTSPSSRKEVSKNDERASSATPTQAGRSAVDVEVPSGPVTTIQDIIDNLSTWEHCKVLRRLHDAKEQAERQSSDLERARDVARNMIRVQEVANGKIRDGILREREVGCAAQRALTGHLEKEKEKAKAGSTTTNWVSIRARVARERKEKERERKECRRQVRLLKQKEERAQRRENGEEVETPPLVPSPSSVSGKGKVGRPKRSAGDGNGAKAKRRTELELLRTPYKNVRRYRNVGVNVGLLEEAQESVEPMEKGRRVVNGMGGAHAAIHPGRDMRWSLRDDGTWSPTARFARGDADPEAAVDEELNVWRKAAIQAVKKENKKGEKNPWVYRVEHKEEGDEWRRMLADSRERAGTPGEMGEDPFSPLPPLEPEGKLPLSQDEEFGGASEVGGSQGGHGEEGGGRENFIEITDFGGSDISDCLDDSEPMPLDEDGYGEYHQQQGREEEGGEWNPDHELSEHDDGADARLRAMRVSAPSPDHSRAGGRSPFYSPAEAPHKRASGEMDIVQSLPAPPISPPWGVGKDRKQTSSSFTSSPRWAPPSPSPSKPPVSPCFSSAAVVSSFPTSTTFNNLCVPSPPEQQQKLHAATSCLLSKLSSSTPNPPCEWIQVGQALKDSSSSSSSSSYSKGLDDFKDTVLRGRRGVLLGDFRDIVKKELVSSEGKYGKVNVEEEDAKNIYGADVNTNALNLNAEKKSSHSTVAKSNTNLQYSVGNNNNTGTETRDLAPSLGIGSGLRSRRKASRESSRTFNSNTTGAPPSSSPAVSTRISAPCSSSNPAKGAMKKHNTHIHQNPGMDSTSKKRVAFAEELEELQSQDPRLEYGDEFPARNARAGLRARSSRKRGLEDASSSPPSPPSSGAPRGFDVRKSYGGREKRARGG
ncbi:hypothetical protein MKZ38_001968 [Zalerion maritima]|uniref:Uncharacterized protein n=1 Tax=Zalerion maritima TaxID=339359 RepID=A0AAD5RQ88_9PEZI|nr:hypothetical protein MKZ38_001968 [Zalerion maritima]